MAATSSLFDTFGQSTFSASWNKTANSADPTKVFANQGTVVVNHTALSQYNALASADTYDFTNSSFFCQVIDAGNQALVSHEAILGFYKDGSNTCWFTISHGNLQAWKRVGGVQTQIGSSVPYDANLHRWLRFREAQGVVYWDTSYDSSDDKNWVNRWSLPDPFNITAVFMQLQSGCWQNEATASGAVFDNFNYKINQFGAAPTDYRVLIAGIDRTADVVTGTLVIDDVLYDQADDISFDMEMVSGLTAPAVDTTIQVWVNQNLEFGGLITQVQSQRYGGQFDVFSITGVDYTRLLDRRLVYQTYNNMTDIAIIQDLITNYAGDQDITTSNVTTTGITVSQISWNYIPLSQALSDLAKLTGRFWYIDYLKDIHYFPAAQNYAPFNIDDNSNTFANMQVSKDSSQLKNRVYVRGSTELSDPFTESQKADGTQTTFLLAEKPHNITMTVNGSAKTIGIENVDDPTTVNFLVNYEQKYIKVGNASTPANGDTLAFTYQYDIPILVSVEDTNSINSDGAYEFYIFDDTISTLQAARDRASAELTDYAQKLVSATYDTMAPGFHSGMYQILNLTPQGVNDSYVVNKVRKQSIAGGLFVYQISLSSAKVIGIIRYLMDMLQIANAVGSFDPNAKVDGLLSLSDSMNALSEVLVDSLGGSAAKWSNDLGTTTNKLKWDLGQWQ